MLNAKSVMNFLLELEEARPTSVGHASIRIVFVIRHSVSS